MNANQNVFVSNKLLIGLVFLAFSWGNISISAETVKAAFDVGSGQTKVTIAEVDETTGRPIRILFADETALLVGHDLKRSKDGNLSDEILTKLKTVLNDYRDIAIKLNAEDLAGVATAVFRESKNGADFIRSVREESGINLQLISQEEEGKIGFATAVAASGKSATQIIAWDSGGASFQISIEVDDQLFVYKGPWGASKVVAAMIEIQGKDFDQVQDPNPVKLEDAFALKDKIEKSLSHASLALRNKLLDPSIEVVAIGGHFSMFNIAVIATGSNLFTKEQIAQSIEDLVGSTTEELARQFPEAEMVLPRLTLIYAVMDHFGINKVKYTPTVGSTLGIFISPRFWSIPTKASKLDVLKEHPTIRY